MIKKLWLCGVRIHDVNDTAKLLSAVSQCRRWVLLWGVNKTVESISAVWMTLQSFFWTSEYLREIKTIYNKISAYK